jgi:hypothetical protein
MIEFDPSIYVRDELSPVPRISVSCEEKRAQTLGQAEELVVLLVASEEVEGVADQLAFLGFRHKDLRPNLLLLPVVHGVEWVERGELKELEGDVMQMEEPELEELLQMVFLERWRCVIMAAARCS